MKTYPMPVSFDGAKFALRYGLGPFDFWNVGPNIVVPDGLPDDPPIFDAPDDPVTYLRRMSKATAASSESHSVVSRAVLLALVDELNLHALKVNAILDAVDASTSLADLKSRIALIADYPARTVAQAKASIISKIDSGGAD